MKHLTLAALCLVATIFTISCKTQSGASTTQSITKGAVKGNWIVTDIRFEGIPAHSKVTVFDQASFSCFKGSQWVLPSNANGSYTLSSTDDGCSTATQPIVWSLYKQNGIDQFQFKKVGTGLKAKNVTDGYRVEISSLSNTTMEWRAAVYYEGKNGYLIYTLQRS
ncbi:Lipocalin-like domain-containing protein [Chitinophaga sp. CF118]|uniref:lipocalin family protein n=1 Tax=Chitinophaga sp. CF118 TaxID=1884367 RepID=UPI0008EA19EF|nr:lipocalin family protein [Chitinophaga sp. CF118]SFE71929.1 Lipocalin-like domain-containing protein [Chitinophaga sp. CF118]